jgi:hypothetical protein
MKTVNANIQRAIAWLKMARSTAVNIVKMQPGPLSYLATVDTPVAQ